MIWIRSQDKRRLLKANYVRKNGSFIEVVHSDMGCTLMGIYSTEEKALKVLDMIQETIIHNETVYAHEFSGSGVRDYDIFQMPEDEKV